jgi:hypothetical protein
VRREISKIEYRTRKITFWTAIIVLASTLIPAIAAVFTYQEVKGFIARIVEKPFEGEWVYLSDYERYYKEPDPDQLHGVGTALILWKYSQNAYSVDISYSIKRDHREEPLAVIVFRGKLVPDASGLPPQQPFNMSAELLHRLHYKEEIHHLRTYQFKDCTYTKAASDGRPETIICVLETPVSKSKVVFTKRTGIH